MAQFSLNVALYLDVEGAQWEHSPGPRGRFPEPSLGRTLWVRGENVLCAKLDQFLISSFRMCLISFSCIDILAAVIQNLQSRF